MATASMGEPMTPDLEALAGRVEALTQSDNSLDVLCELALFKPDAHWKSVRANDAGTKVIYTTVTGREETYWAPDWTAFKRDETVKMLRARADGGSNG